MPGIGKARSTHVSDATLPQVTGDDVPVRLPGNGPERRFLVTGVVGPRINVCDFPVRLHVIGPKRSFRIPDAVRQPSPDSMRQRAIFANRDCA